jgi:hypothetical protein
VVLQRLLRSKPGTLTGTLTDGDGNPVAAAGAVTVGVVSLSGAVIFAPGTATTAPGDTGVYQVAVSATQTAQLDMWTATWTDAGDGSIDTTQHEICGGHHFSVADARASDPSLDDAAKYPDTEIIRRRRSVEDEVEYICDVAFVPRYGRAILDGNATPELYLPASRLRSIRSVTVTASNGAPVAFGTVALAALNAQLANGGGDDDYLLQRNDFGIWDEGRRNVVIEFEHGWDAPPVDLQAAELFRLRYVLNRTRTAIPDRATSFVTEGGTSYKLDSPDAFKVGIPDIDAVYGRYSTRNTGNKTTPVSRSVNFDPSYFSVYHGGRR